MSAIYGVGHVGIYTEDLMRMQDFYTRVLGLRSPMKICTEASCS